jgi:hypothetical protein
MIERQEARTPEPHAAFVGAGREILARDNFCQRTVLENIQRRQMRGCLPGTHRTLEQIWLIHDIHC